jgi:hypothetical protein
LHGCEEEKREDTEQLHCARNGVQIVYTRADSVCSSIGIEAIFMHIGAMG